MVLHLDLGERGYDITVERGALSRVGEIFSLGRRVLIVTDSGVPAVYAETVAAGSEPTLLFADRFPFVYLAEDYGIRYVAAFEGCTTEAEATPETIIHLAKHADEWDLRWIMTTESSDGKLARSVIRATEKKDQAVAVLNSMQSVSAKEAERGDTYLGIMEQNLDVLRRVLSS